MKTTEVMLKTKWNLWRFLDLILSVSLKVNFMRFSLFPIVYGGSDSRLLHLFYKYPIILRYCFIISRVNTVQIFTSRKFVFFNIICITFLEVAPRPYCERAANNEHNRKMKGTKVDVSISFYFDALYIPNTLILHAESFYLIYILVVLWHTLR